MAKVTEKIKNLSPSKVDLFLGCRRLFYYTHVNPPFKPPENKYFLIGNIAHKVLENSYKQSLATPEMKWSKALGDNFRNAALAYKAKEHIARGTISNSDLYSIKNMLSNYLEHIVKKKPKPDVYLIEKLAKIEIGGVDVWLKADRIDRIKENEYKVVDYKSGRPSTKKDERNSVQIPSYALLVRSLLGKKVRVTGSYCYLKHLGTSNGIHNYNVDEDWIDLAVDKYIFVAKELKNGCKFIRNTYYKYCRICDFKAYCNEDSDGI